MSRSQDDFFSAFNKAFPCLVEDEITAPFIAIVLTAISRQMIPILNGMLPKNCQLLSDDVEQLMMLWDQFNPRARDVAITEEDFVLLFQQIVPVLPTRSYKDVRKMGPGPQTDLNHYYIKKLRRGAHPKNTWVFLQPRIEAFREHGGQREIAQDFVIETASGYRLVLDCVVRFPEVPFLHVKVGSGILTAELTTELLSLRNAGVWEASGSNSEVAISIPLEERAFSGLYDSVRHPFGYDKMQHMVAKNSLDHAVITMLNEAGLRIKHITPRYRKFGF